MIFWIYFFKIFVRGIAYWYVCTYLKGWVMEGGTGVAALAWIPCIAWYLHKSNVRIYPEIWHKILYDVISQLNFSYGYGCLYLGIIMSGWEVIKGSGNSALYSRHLSNFCNTLQIGLTCYGIWLLFFVHQQKRRKYAANISLWKSRL